MDGSAIGPDFTGFGVQTEMRIQINGVVGPGSGAELGPGRTVIASGGNRVGGKSC
jgi:hypothetical protein